VLALAAVNNCNNLKDARSNLLQQTVIQGIEVGVNDGVSPQMRVVPVGSISFKPKKSVYFLGRHVLGQRGGEVVERSLLVGGSDGAHGFNVRAGEPDAALACTDSVRPPSYLKHNR
jgi:hypothetical protein